MNEREDIKGEAAKALKRLEDADNRSNAQDGLAAYWAGSAAHSYLRSVAAGNFKLVKPKKIHQNK